MNLKPTFLHPLISRTVGIQTFLQGNTGTCGCRSSIQWGITTCYIVWRQQNGDLQHVEAVVQWPTTERHRAGGRNNVWQLEDLLVPHRQRHLRLLSRGRCLASLTRWWCGGSVCSQGRKCKVTPWGRPKLQHK